MTLHYYYARVPSAVGYDAMKKTRTTSVNASVLEDVDSNESNDRYEFQTVFQKEEPLVHIAHSECIGPVKKLLSRFMRHEAYSNLSGSELKQLDVGSLEGLKQVLEIGSDTEKEMRNWDPQVKKSFRTSAHAFYISTARHLIKRLPLDNKLQK